MDGMEYRPQIAAELGNGATQFMQPLAGKQRARYSRFVVAMKVILPAVALILVGLLFVLPQIKVDNNRLVFGISSAQSTKTESPSMVNARFVGSDSRDQPFSITADLAKNLLIGTSEVELEMPKADLAVRDGSWLVLTATSGRFDQLGKILRLNGAVNLFHDSGYEFKTEEAQIDLARGMARSEKPVRGQGPFGQLAAEGFQIENRGARMFFTGKAKLTIYPAALEAQK
ncbi:MAG: LPS export ABC transporter periplasmic protein LptC [Rhodospirillales bacterium]|nr:LPS export ABC transporter periplasmic protein LptC [Rhodospirillales bacterium]